MCIRDSSLIAAREAARLRPVRALPVEPPAIYPEHELSYLANVLSSHAVSYTHL